MKNWQMKSIMVAAVMFCFPAGSTAWAGQGVRPETRERMMQEVMSENGEPKKRIAELKAETAKLKLTEQSLDNLRQEGLLNEVVGKLEALKDRNFHTEDEFLEAVRQQIGNDHTVRYKAQIVKHALKHAADDISEIKRITKMLEAQNRAIEALQAHNRALAARLAELEAAQHARAQKQEEPESQPGRAEAEGGDLKQLEERVKELETEKTAREEASRSIIRQALSTLGSKINESVSLGGVIEVLAGRSEDFSGRTESVLKLNTAELQFEIQVNEWTLGNLVIEFVDGTDVLFPTTAGFNAGVERINIDTAFLTIGDPQRFPPFVQFGRMILPFGISTGDPVADVLSIEDPLTIEAFEMRNTTIGFGLGFPTPAPTPATPPVTPPPVRPLLITPLVGLLSRGLGYDPPPTRPPRPTPITLKPAPPLFNVGFYSYDGSTFKGVEKAGLDPGQHISATAGFRTQGHCGRPFDQLGAEGASWLEVFCPWSIDVDVDYISSVFDSRFLSSEYRSFLGRIGFVPGMAAHVKATLGPVSLVGEWNGAISSAKFVDDSGTFVSLEPSAWHISLNYQFDWNPWVEVIGDQGTYISFGYSESRDLAGVTQLVNGDPTRVGFAPQRRFLVTLGEWVLEGVLLRIEYAHIEDYSRSERGTGRSADGVFTTITYVW